MSTDGGGPASELLSPTQFARLKDLFALACERPESERSALLESVREQDAELARALRRLLADDRPETVLGAIEEVMHSAAAALARNETETEWLEGAVPSPGRRSGDGFDASAYPNLVGSEIGPYRLLEVVGEGGMGVVYRAEQVGSFRREVALKLVKAGMDSRQVLARFESERQALALMEHPNIAHLHDGGTTSEGRPYFVMEFVKGVPFNSYCDLHRLDLDERLQLFLQVCAGVQHAHHKGVIHRDLKPSNVLVSVHEGQPAPKIIDFGIAKAIAQPLTEGTLYTALGSWIGTPEYMSPEQAGVTGLDVDTRADVYSLGVMLYESLVGVVPFSFQGDERLGLEQIRRSIWEDEADPPSTRAAKLGEQAPTAASNRRLDPKSHRRQLRGDLGWITMRCLEKDRSRRYGSPADLAADLSRYLADQPVMAGPPGLRYRAGKFVRRHRLAVAAVLFVLASLAVSVVGISLALVRAQRAESAARQEAATAERVIQFLVDLFTVADPEEARGETITAREILDRGARSISEELGDEPTVQARLQNIIATVYQGLGLYTDAVPLLESALATQRREAAAGGGGAAEVEVAIAAHGLASVLHDREEYEPAERLYREALSTLRRQLGPGHAYVAVNSNNLAMLLKARGQLVEAEELYRAALEVNRRLLGDESREVASGLNNIALVRLDRGDYPEADRLLRESLSTTRKLLGEDHPNVASSLTSLGMVRAKRGDLAGAEERFREALDLHLRIYEEDHPLVGTARNNLGGALYRLGRLSDAEQQFQQALEIWVRSHGGESGAAALARYGLAAVAQLRGDGERAERLYQEVLATRLQFLGDDHPQVAEAQHALAVLLHEQGRYDEAETLLGEALALRRRSLGADHPQVAESSTELAAVAIAQGDLEAASRFLDEAESILRSGVGREQELMRCLAVRAEGLMAEGQLEEAALPLEEAMELARGVLGEGHWRVAALGLLQGARLSGLGRFGEAEGILVASRDSLASVLGASSPLVREASERLDRLPASR